MQAILVLAMCTLGSGVRLLKRDLSGYQLAKCNDGTPAAYYHDQDVRAAGDKVMIYLPDGGDCRSVGDCTKRCNDDPTLCSGPKESVLEQQGGIWSSNNTENPFAEHFKIFIHYCSSDNFAGTNNGSLSTGNLIFHGKHILTAVLKDLVSRFGIERAASVVLAGSGSGAKAVGYNCDYVSEALRGVNPTVDLRCLADGPDFVPWWVKTDDEQCGEKDIHKLEAEKKFWGRLDDVSCVTENKVKLGSAPLAHRCGVMSQYWQDIESPLLIVASQLDSVYYESSLCIPGAEDVGHRRYTAAWRRGVVALAESIQARGHNLTSCFIPSCASHTLLAGSLAEVYLTGVKVGEEALVLREVISRWLRDENNQAVDALGKENSQCPSPSPLKAACGNLLGCGTRAGVPRRKSVYYAQSFDHRLSPPSSLFPKTYNRKCSLDPWYGSCGRRTTSPAISFGHALGHGEVHTRTAHDEAGRRKRLWQKLYTLQYLKKLFQKYKQAYAREYQAVDDYPRARVNVHPAVVRAKTIPTIIRPKRPRVVVAPRRVPSVITVERPPIVRVADSLPSVPAPDYDYAAVDYDYDLVDQDYAQDYDYAAYDYAQYYDYADAGCNTGCALAKIIRAAQQKKKKKEKRDGSKEKKKKKKKDKKSRSSSSSSSSSSDSD
eukprot:TRINITY_DN2796_c0_g1_i5.p1 TRINITY_DN2796_c0_g1~~TRINITY_DN2796_c0_g1_i5.p1  ORF type:complete len:659 (-),score=174.49 TRINITY_DN2796_c0_g1_i5:130-2106(-)